MRGSGPRAQAEGHGILEKQLPQVPSARGSLQLVDAVPFGGPQQQIAAPRGRRPGAFLDARVT